MKKRALILALAGIMAASLIGCGSLKDDAVVVKAGDEEITAGVANFYARYTQAQYETYFASYLGGDDMWSRNASDGKTYEESIKKTLLDDLKNMGFDFFHQSVLLTDFGVGFRPQQYPFGRRKAITIRNEKADTNPAIPTIPGCLGGLLPEAVFPTSRCKNDRAANAALCLIRSY